MGFIRNAKERRIARELDRQGLSAAATDPEVEVGSGLPDLNPAHGRNTRRELHIKARHFRTDA